jgi:hypothetical protein
MLTCDVGAAGAFVCSAGASPAAIVARATTATSSEAKADGERQMDTLADMGSSFACQTLDRTTN